MKILLGAFTCKKSQLLCQLCNNWTSCFVVLLMLININQVLFNRRLGAGTICECITKGRAEESFYHRG